MSLWQRLQRYVGVDVDVDLFGRLRVLFGIVAVCKFIGFTSPLPRLVHGKLELGLPLHRYPHAIFPPEALGTSWALPVPTAATYQLVETVGLVLAVTMTIGLLSRLSSLGVFLTGLWLLLVDPAGFKHNLWAMTVFAGLLALAPCGAAHAVDAAIRRRTRWPSPTTTWILPLRLVQLQVGVIYLFSTLRKLNDGWATGHLLRSTVEKLPEQLAAIGLSALAPLLTWSGWYVLGAWVTVALEGFLAVGLYSRRLRPWALATGIVLHLWIDLALDVGAYSLVMFAAYVAFIAPTPHAHTLRVPAGHRLQRVVRGLDWLARFVVVAVDDLDVVEVADGAGVVVARGRDAVVFALLRLPLTFVPAFVVVQVDALKGWRRRRTG